MIYDYKTHIAKNGANVYFVAEGNESGAIEKTTITPEIRCVSVIPSRRHTPRLPSESVVTADCLRPTRT